MQIPSLEYYAGDDIIGPDKFRISPSSIGKFFERPHEWYRGQVLDESTFDGNTASVLGTVVHYCAECVALGLEPDTGEISKYLDQQATNPNVDVNIVTNEAPVVAKELIDNFVSKNKATHVERFIHYDLGDGVVVGGSIDRLDNEYIDDYKTTANKTPPSYFRMGYKYQLLTYAWILKQLGEPRKYLRLIYVNRPSGGGISEKTGKPLKFYPPKVSTVVHEITPEDYEFIESILMLIKETYLKGIESPELLHLLYKDMRLKQKPKGVFDD